jgi:hypothetical protein
MACGWLLWGATADFTAFLGGWRLPAAGTAIIEAMLSVSLTLLLIDAFRRHFNTQGRLAQALSRDAYAAFILQHPVLVAGALSLRPIPLNADLKYPLLAGGALIAVFALVHYLKRHA